MNITEQSLIHEEIKSILNWGHACHHSVQNLLSSHLPAKNIKIIICETTILPVISCEYETRSPTLREKHRLKVFENRVLRRILVSKKDEIIGGWRTL
jgi:hypothetical protein